MEDTISRKAWSKVTSSTGATGPQTRCMVQSPSASTGTPSSPRTTVERSTPATEVEQNGDATVRKKKTSSQLAAGCESNRAAAVDKQVSESNKCDLPEPSQTVLCGKTATDLSAPVPHRELSIGCTGSDGGGRRTASSSNAPAGRKGTEIKVGQKWQRVHCSRIIHVTGIELPAPIMCDTLWWVSQGERL